MAAPMPYIVRMPKGDPKKARFEFRPTEEGYRLMELLSKRHGIPKSAVIEMSLRAQARQDGIAPAENPPAAPARTDAGKPEK